jgi:radical SAM-linked protein
MRLRITFSKSGGLRYTGHLDLHSIWERTARRAGLPLAYTQGFHPTPRIQLASALPLGFIGRAEIVDMWLKEDAEPNQSLPQPGDVRPYKDALQPAAPPGLVILSAEAVDEKSPALQTQVVFAEYAVTLLDPVDRSDLETRLAQMLGAGSLPRVRREKQYDLRPLIETLELLPEDGSGTILQMKLAAREGATGRPDEVLAVLDIPIEATRIERTRLILKDV